MAVKVNPFAAAAKKTTSVLKSKSPIYVADAIVGPDGEIVHSKEEVIRSIERVAEGVRLENMGKSMKEQNRDVLTAFATSRFTQDWVNKRTRPENPKVVTNEVGDGVFCTVGFVDSAKKLDDAQYSDLVAMVGAAKAEDCVIRRHDFTIEPTLLDQTCKVNKGGRVIEQNVMEALTEALQEKFEPSEGILAGLFVAKEKFETKKGLIDRGPELVTTGSSSADAARLAQFLDAIRSTISLKPGGTPQ